MVSVLTSRMQRDVYRNNWSHWWKEIKISEKADECYQFLDSFVFISRRAKIHGSRKDSIALRCIHAEVHSPHLIATSDDTSKCRYELRNNRSALWVASKCMKPPTNSKQNAFKVVITICEVVKRSQTICVCCAAHCSVTYTAQYANENCISTNLLILLVSVERRRAVMRYAIAFSLRLCRRRHDMLMRASFSF